MNRYLGGERVDFSTAAARKALAGKRVQYLRKCDIDRSGRGYLFPRIDIVDYCKGRQIVFMGQNSVFVSDMVEMRILADEPEP